MIAVATTLVELYRADGTVQTFDKVLDTSMAQWVAEQYADVNKCGCVIKYKANGTELARAGNVQS